MAPPGQLASTRACATTGSIGVPVGVHTDEPIMVTSGAPPASTRTAPLTNWPVTQGGVEVVLRAHAAIAYGLVSVTTGWPETVTRGNGASGVAWPACVHSTVAPR